MGTEQNAYMWMERIGMRWQCTHNQYMNVTPVKTKGGMSTLICFLFNKITNFFWLFPCGISFCKICECKKKSSAPLLLNLEWHRTHTNTFAHDEYTTTNTVYPTSPPSQQTYNFYKTVPPAFRWNEEKTKKTWCEYVNWRRTHANHAAAHHTMRGTSTRSIAPLSAYVVSLIHSQVEYARRHQCARAAHSVQRSLCYMLCGCTRTRCLMCILHLLFDERGRERGWFSLYAAGRYEWLGTEADPRVRYWLAAYENRMTITTATEKLRGNERIKTERYSKKTGKHMPFTLPTIHTETNVIQRVGAELYARQSVGVALILSIRTHVVWEFNYGKHVFKR